MRHAFYVVSALALALVGVSGVRGDVLSPSPNLPSQQSDYLGRGPVVYQTTGLTAVVSNIDHSDFSNSTPPPLNVGGTSQDIFTSLLRGNLVVNAGPLTPFIAAASVIVNVVKASGPVNSPLGTFNTEMIQLNVTGLPGGALIRESPTLQSLGVTTISDAGNGLFRITSFFDIFTELSVDNGATWIPAQSSERVEAVSPEPSSLILGAIGAVVFLGAMRARRRRSRTAA
jgi:hypothetical protein